MGIICLCQAQGTNFVLLYSHIYLTIYNILHTKVIFHIFDTETSMHFFGVINIHVLQMPDTT